MKKFLSILTTVALMVASMGLTAFAADVPTIKVAEVEASQNEEVTVKVSVEGNTGLGAYTMKLGYDSEALTLTGLSEGTLTSSEASKIFMGKVETNKVTFTTFGSVFYDDGVLFTATFKVNAVSGTYPITVDVESFGIDSDIPHNVTNGSVTVAHEHSYTNWTQTTAPTCTQPGIETGTCACGATTTRTGAAATGHSYGEYTVTTEPTCTEKGVATATCSVCGATTTKEVAATGHTWGEWEETKAPTCTEAGEKVHTCTVCGATVTAEVAATGHNYEDGKCTDCGAEEPKTPATDNKDNNKDNTNNTVQTGDNASVTLWVALMAVAVAGVVVVIKKRRVNG